MSSCSQHRSSTKITQRYLVQGQIGDNFPVKRADTTTERVHLARSPSDRYSRYARATITIIAPSENSHAATELEVSAHQLRAVPEGADVLALNTLTHFLLMLDEQFNTMVHEATEKRVCIHYNYAHLCSWQTAIAAIKTVYITISVSK